MKKTTKILLGVAGAAVLGGYLLTKKGAAVANATVVGGYNVGFFYSPTNYVWSNDIASTLSAANVWVSKNVPSGVQYGITQTTVGGVVVVASGVGAAP